MSQGMFRPLRTFRFPFGPMEKTIEAFRGKRRRQLVFVAAAVTIVTATVFGFRFFRSAEVEIPAATDRVTLATVRSTVSSDAKISADVRSLSFSVGGTVREIRKRPGDSVGSGEVVAVLDSGIPESEVRVAEAALERAKALLAARVASDPETVRKAEREYSAAVSALSSEKIRSAGDADRRSASLVIAEAALASAETDEIAVRNSAISSVSAARATLSADEEALESARRSLDRVAKESEDRILRARNRTGLAASALRSKASSFFSEADAFLGVTETNRFRNDPFETYLSAKDSSRLVRASSAYLSASSAYLSASSTGVLALGDAIVATLRETELVLAATVPSTAFSESAIAEKSAAFRNMLTEFLNLRQALSDAVSAEAAEIAAAKSERSSASDAVLAAQAQKERSDTSLQSVLSDAERSVLAARSARTSAEAALVSARTDARAAFDDGIASVSDAEKRASVSESALRSAKSSSSASEIRALEADVASARASLERALRNLADAELRSPCDGVVGEIRFEVGESVQPSQAVMTVADVSNPSAVSYVEELDVPKIRSGQPAVVRIDAFPDREFPGSVKSVSPAATVDSAGIVTYRTEVSFSPASVSGAFEGMSATVDFVTEEAVSVPTVPARAIVAAS